VVEERERLAAISLLYRRFEESFGLEEQQGERWKGANPLRSGK